jgi:MoxR-like ATPase
LEYKEMTKDDLTKKIAALRTNLERVIRGKADKIDLAMTALISGGHLLIEDIPGVGKTTLAHGLARSINCSFQRIQFTSDLLPSDVIGVTIYNQATHSFEFKQGPIFANIVLADEINRATPKTQSALLEAMNDRQVSVERSTYRLPEPNMIIATQNPLDHAGTFPLPESQLDRFSMRIRMGYPDEATETAIIRSKANALDPERLLPVLTGEDVSALKAAAEHVAVDDDVLAYAMAVIARTRAHKDIRLGVSPRGAMVLYRTARAYALVAGRAYVTPDDIKTLAYPVLGHRVLIAKYADEDTADADLLLEEILDSTPVPV